MASFLVIVLSYHTKNLDMGKSSFFSGQPIFTQLLSLIPSHLITKAVKDHQADRYCKRFYARDHLVSMLYTAFFQVTSLRELTTGLSVNSQRLRHLGLENTPKKSTISDANTRRDAAFFEQLYASLYYHFFPDSSTDKTYIMDSTTISLFTEVMRGAGSPRKDGKKKGGVKVHTLINARHDLPAFVSITEGKTADISQLQYISLPEGSTIIFDKAYVSYVMFKEWGDKINWITRLRQTASFVVQKKLKLTPESLKAGVQTDQNIKLGRESNQRKTPLIDARLIHFYDAEKKRSFEFITNDFTSPPEQIAQYYKRRWQIELLFKRIKQRYPLRYFLGDSANAIKIQIWAALICDLLVQVIKNRVNTMRKNKWSYANIAALIKHHLMTYISLIEFLKNPEKAALQYQPPDGQLQLWGLSP